MNTPPFTSTSSIAAPSLPLPQRLADALAQLPSYLHVADVQGLAQLATQGVLGVAGLAETVHGHVYKTIAAPFGLLGSRFIDATPGSSGVHPTGITGLVYGGVKSVARLAGGTVNAALAGAAPLLKQRFGVQKSSPQREAVLSAINGVLGDQLLATANPLAIDMQLRVRGIPLALNKTTLATQLGTPTGKLLVVAHGLCMNDLQWTSRGQNRTHNHAELLAQSCGYTPVFLRYNSGLHTSINGEQLAALLEQLVAAWPQPLQEVSLLAHSMGGLVARSAAQHAALNHMAWRQQLKNIVFLGTPHHGAPLERVGNWIDTMLGSNPVTKPFAAIGQIRSSGITDLRYGHVLTSSWEGKDRFERQPDGREPLPLPAGVRCFTVAATTSSQANALKDATIGDGLVLVTSALGQHDEARHGLSFEPAHRMVAYGVNHMALLDNAAVAAQVVKWLE